MYATQANLETRFGTEELAQLTDRVNGTTIDAAVVARAIADAEAEIDASLGTRYQLPLTSVPPRLERLTCDMARYFLYDDRVTESVRVRYEDAQRTLKAIAAGTQTIEGAAVLEKQAAGGGVSSRTPARVFNADTLAGY